MCWILSDLKVLQISFLNCFSFLKVNLTLTIVRKSSPLSLCMLFIPLRPESYKLNLRFQDSGFVMPSFSLALTENKFYRRTACKYRVIFNQNEINKAVPFGVNTESRIILGLVKISFQEVILD